MNQKETIAAEQKKLEELRAELAKTQSDFNFFYKDLDAAINAIDKERTALSVKEDTVKFMVARALFPDDAEAAHKFASGYSHFAGRNDFIASVSAEAQISHGVQFLETDSMVWDHFHIILAEATAPITAKSNELFEKRNAILNESYANICDKLHRLDSDIRYKVDFIENLKDLSYFRQWAKERKAAEERKEMQVKRAAALAYANDKLKPVFDKMRQAAAEAVKAQGF